MLQVQEQKRMGGEKFHVKKGSLSFSTESVNEILVPAEIREGSFTIYGADGRAAGGFVFSSQLPVKVLTESFEGSREVIGYRIDAAGRKPGEHIDGAFSIISDNGEYQLPFHIVIEEPRLESSLGPIHNLIHFTNLARVNWQEAVSLFYQKGFRRALEESVNSGYTGTYSTSAGDPADRTVPHPLNLLTLYRGLSVREGNEHNVEEFLISAGQKQPVEYSADVREITMDLSAMEPRRMVREVRQIRVRRSGWGYTDARLAVTGDYLAVDPVELRESDFHEGIAVVSVVIDPSRMHAGRNFGHVLLTPAYGPQISIPVTVSCCMNTALRTLHRKEEHSIRAQMMHEYLGLRAKKVTGQEFRDHMASLIRRLQDIDRNNPMTALYRIHYLLTVHDDNDALWELQALNRNLSGIDQAGELPLFPIARFDLEDDMIYAYRMYLTSLCAEAQMQVSTSSGTAAPAYKAAGTAANPSVIRDTIHAIEQMHQQNPDNFWITWLLLYADPAYEQRPAQAARVLRDQYVRGSRSPILYMEAFRLIRDHQELVPDLDDYTLQVFSFGARNGMLTDTVIVQITSLALRQKGFSVKLFRILARIYSDEKVPELRRRDVLEGICTILIRGNVTDSRYFDWYRKGVEQGLNITRLLDYFMLSLPSDYEGDLPQMVLMYYAWQNSMPYGPCAYLYRYVCEHRNESPALYQQYAPAIDQFTLSQMSEHRISRDLAYLYDRYLTAGRVLSNETASAFVPAVFSCAVHTDLPDAQRIVLVYDHFISEQYCPLDNGTAYLPVYGKENVLFFEDNEGNRFASSVPFILNRMMDYEKLAPVLSPYETNNAWYDLYLVRSGKEDLSGDNVRRAQKLTGSPEVPLEGRNALRLKLLDYYEKTDDSSSLRVLLNSLEPDGFDTEERSSLIRRLTVHGFLEKAFGWLCRFGTDGVDGDVLLRLTSGILRENIPADDQSLSALAYDAFRAGRYDARILEYLGTFWDGATKDLDRVRQAAAEYGLDSYEPGRRELIQMLFTGESAGSRSDLTELCRAAGDDPEFLADVLAQSSHFYFVNRAPMKESEFSLIGQYGLDGVPLLDICRIAWLQNRSEQQGEAAGQDLEITGIFLTDLLERGTVFPFFRQFIGVVPGMQVYADETLVEYRRGSSADPGTKILYHYAMEHGGARDRYAAKEMKEMYEGVYVAGFLLFFGEQMHYYITDDPEEKNIVESGTVSQDARLSGTLNDRFGKINEIAMLVSLGRDEEALKKLGAYGQRAYLTGRLFAKEKE